MMNRFILLAVLCFLTACTTTYRPIAPSQSAPDSVAGHGFVIGSMSFAGDFPTDVKRPIGSSVNFRHVFYNFQFQSKSYDVDGVSGTLADVPSDIWGNYLKETGDYQLEEGRGYVFVVALPPGKYELYNYYFGNGHVKTISKEHFSIPFDVQADTVHYIGNIHFQHLYRENFIGITTSYDSDIFFRNGIVRDMPLIYERHPYLKNLKNETQLLDWPDSEN